MTELRGVHAWLQQSLIIMTKRWAYLSLLVVQPYDLPCHVGQLHSQQAIVNEQAAGILSFSQNSASVKSGTAAWQDDVMHLAGCC